MSCDDNSQQTVSLKALFPFLQQCCASNGGGYYTLYLRLRSIAVKVGQKITAHQVVGTVGGESTPEGPHLEFQVRTPSSSGAPTPVDPLNWLRARANTQ